jgi:hypothetical protein
MLLLIKDAALADAFISRTLLYLIVRCYVTSDKICKGIIHNNSTYDNTIALLI